MNAAFCLLFVSSLSRLRGRNLTLQKWSSTYGKSDSRGTTALNFLKGSQIFRYHFTFPNAAPMKLIDAHDSHQVRIYDELH
jgi:hypothetical protein